MLTMRRLLGVGVAVLLGLWAAACSSPTHPTLSATPQSRIITLSGNLAFNDSVPVGSSAIQALTIGNSGTAPLTWTAIGTSNAAFTADPQSGTVAAGGSGTVKITFSPTVVSSNYNATVTVTSNATSGTNTIAASGTGKSAYTRLLTITGAMIAFGTPTLDFGRITWNTTKTLSFTFSNSGNAALTISSFTKGGWLNSGNQFTVNVATPFTINPGQSVPVSVTFWPRFASGLCTYETLIQVHSDQTGGDTEGGLMGKAFSCT